jgi:hypothetical protein
MKKNFYQKVYSFPNGYGASVVSHDNSYGGKNGLFEVAVLRGDDIVYDTPITQDTVGFCEFGDVAEVLEKIKNLPATNN